MFTSNGRKKPELQRLSFKCCSIFRVASSVKVKESKASVSFCFLMKERNMQVTFICSKKKQVQNEQVDRLRCKTSELSGHVVCITLQTQFANFVAKVKCSSHKPIETMHSEAYFRCKKAEC